MPLTANGTRFVPLWIIIKRLAKAILPKRVFTSISSFRSRQFQQRLLSKTGHADAVSDLTDHFGYTVLHGPFKGMSYPPESLLSRGGIPLLLGTYESELHSIIASILPGQYKRIIDIGCAEGYYAVGLARLTGTQVYAFDTERREREFCKRMAQLNGVGKSVTVRGWCDKHVLKRIVAGKCLVISDCEGYERELFTSDIIPLFAESDLIIELHEAHEDRRTEEEIMSRFLPSHSAELLTFSPTKFDASFIGETASVPSGLRFVREDRPENQRWVHLRARRSD